jgi:uncharacterized membrane protein
MDKKNVDKNVVVAVFNVESEAYKALTELRQTASGATYLVSAAALVKKENGACRLLDGFDTGADTSKGTAVGGIVGMVVGALAGPIGMLLGLSTGSLIGMSSDASNAAYGASMLEQIADKLDDDTVAIIAITDEETEEALDGRLSAYDTVIARFDAKAVAAEVDEAYKMQDEMARQAREKLREENAETLRQNFTK